MRGKFEAHLWGNPAVTEEKALSRTRARVSLQAHRSVACEISPLEAMEDLLCLVNETSRQAKQLLQNPFPDFTMLSKKPL